MLHVLTNAIRICSGVGQAQQEQAKRRIKSNSIPLHLGGFSSKLSVQNIIDYVQNEYIHHSLNFNSCVYNVISLLTIRLMSQKKFILLT
jgi:hypothetical protein